MHIFCDFDGTISARDSTDAVLTALADPGWTSIEERWEAGEITSAACMRDQVALIRGDAAALDAVLATVQLTPGFVAFAAWARAGQMPLTIVSDGVGHFIQRILARHGLKLPIVANRLTIDPAGGYALEQPHARPGCGSGVCKCAILESVVQRRPVVYVGDGRSDFCVSARPDILFAKASLARHCESQGTPFIPFDDFHDVRSVLEAIRQPALTLAAAA